MGRPRAGKISLSEAKTAALLHGTKETVMPNDPPFREASVFIEQEGANKFKIQSGELEQIGAQLRGRREFSIFHSIILPLIVSLATIIFTSAFQYVSWFNSVGVQYATDVADKAARTYERSAAAIGTRHYAMVVFLPSLRDLVHAKANAALGARAQSNAIKERDIVLSPAVAKKRTLGGEASSLSAVVQSAEEPKDNEISLHKFVLDTKQKRFASYYEQLKLWNENYDHLLSEIEYALDRPVFAQAGRENEDFRVSRHHFKQIGCLNSITEELQKLTLNPHILKFRFAGIHSCFMKIHGALDEQLGEAMAKPLPAFSKPTESQIKDQLDALLAMTNEFRCYAHQRIDYYNMQKELAIFSLLYVRRRLTDAAKTEALKHFEHSAARCSAQARPV
jgi:hypothetical protein